jgi:hypothetical protein
MKTRNHFYIVRCSHTARPEPVKMAPRPLAVVDISNSFDSLPTDMSVGTK